MKTPLLALAVTLSAHAVPITVIDNQHSGPYQQTLVFDLAWGAPLTEVMPLPAGPGLVSSIRLVDMGPNGGLAFFLETLAHSGAYEWMIGPWTYEAGLEPFPLSVEYSGFPFIWHLEAEPLADPQAGRFTFTSQPNPYGVPDSASTAKLLGVAVGILLGVHRLTRKAP